MVRYGQITCKSSISDQKYCFSFILDWIGAVLTNVLQIQSVSVFLLECILHGPTPLGKTQITRQRFDRSQNQDQIWVEDWKPPIYHQKYCFSSSMSCTGAVFVNVPQIQSCTSVFWQKGILHTPTLLGKTPITRQPFDLSSIMCWVKQFYLRCIKFSLGYQCIVVGTHFSWSDYPQDMLIAHCLISNRYQKQMTLKAMTLNLKYWSSSLID